MNAYPYHRHKTYLLFFFNGLRINKSEFCQKNDGLFLTKTKLKDNRHTPN